MVGYLQMLNTGEERERFAEIYLTYRNEMHYVAMSILHNPHDAEDAVHQAFLSIIKVINKFPAVKSDEAKAYYITIVSNKAVDIIRERKGIIDADYDERIASTVIDERVLGLHIPVPETDDILAIALSKMPAKYRDFLLLYYDGGYSTTEIAKVFSLKRSTVQKRIWRAKEMLREYYTREAQE